MSNENLESLLNKIGRIEKDSLSRKTPKYAEKRLQKLQQTSSKKAAAEHMYREIKKITNTTPSRGNQ